MSQQIKQLVMPGEEIEIKEVGETIKEIVLGPGLRKESENVIVASKSGILKRKENNFYWIDSHQKRYVPARSEYVIGIITIKSAEVFKVDIGASEYASLSCLAFENATKRNRPNLEIGDLVYCRVLTGSKDMEPELVCIDANGKASGLGQLKDGFMFKVSLDYCRRLLSSSSEFLRLLAKQLAPFEVTIGMNGRIWVKSSTTKQTIFLVEAIKQYARIGEKDCASFVDNLIKNHSLIE